LKNNYYSSLFIFLLVLISCQQKPSKENRFITGKGDTLTGPLVAMLDPGEKADSIRYRNVLVRLGLTIGVENRTPDALDSLLASQLSMESGVDWSSKAANLLHDAALRVREKLESTNNCSTTVAFAESLFQVVNTGNNFPFPKISSHPSADNKTSWTSTIFSELFNLDGPTATALAIFTNQQTSAQDNKKLLNNIKGLVFDSTRRTDTAIGGKKIIKKPDVSSEVIKTDILKYRDQNSILESITKRVPEIKSLYKTHLKRNENLHGTVKVSFYLAPNGKVLEVSIAKTDIVDSGFLEPLLKYLKQIDFKSIPADAGNMRFEFPFEFDRDM
jgi:TonB family protein